MNECLSHVLRAFACAVALGAVSLSAISAAPVNNNRWVLQPGNQLYVPNRSGEHVPVSLSVLEGMVNVSQSVPLQVATSTVPIAVEVGQAVSKATVVKTIGSALLGAAGGPVGLALTAGYLGAAGLAWWADNGFKDAGGQMGIDPGKAPDGPPGTLYQGSDDAGNTGLWVNSAESACGWIAGRWVEILGGQATATVISYPSPSSCVIQKYHRDGAFNGNVTHTLGTKSGGITCADGSPVRNDGLCQSNNLRAATQGDIDSAINRSAPSDDAAMDMANNWLKRGAHFDGPSPYLKGPSTSPGPTTTKKTTNPDGSSTTSTTKVTNNYTYNNTGVSVNTTTTTTNSNGSSEEVTEDQPSPDPDSDVPGLCDLFPNISACAELGTPSDEPLPSDSIDVGPIPSLPLPGGGCPAPVSFSVPRLGSFELSYDPICQWLSYLKPLVLLMGAFGAWKVFSGSFRV